MSPTQGGRRELDFSEFEGFLTAMSPWNCDLLPLDAGRFHARVSQTQLPEGAIQTFQFNRRFVQRAVLPQEAVAIAIPYRDVLWRGGDTSAGTFLPLSGGEFECVSGPGFLGAALQVSKEHFLRTAQRLGYNDGEWLLGSSQARRLQGFWAQKAVQVAVASSYTESIRLLGGHSLVELLVLASSVESSRNPTLRSRGREQRHAAVSHALQFLRSRTATGENTSVTELAAAAAVSERTLRDAFVERFDVPPKQYLASQSLELACRALRKADPQSTTVREVAARYGFQHMGQFSKDFQKKFSLRPSVVLHSS